MKLSLAISWLPVFFTLAACAPLNPKDEKLATQYDVLIEEAKKIEASYCDTPAVAKPGLDKNFKYGCFCGAGHPNIARSSDASFASWGSDEQQSYLNEYFKIKPIDEIDAACQAHDVCWVVHERPELSCNDRFVHALDQLDKKFTSKRPFFEVDNLEFRCATLARDMHMATSVIMDYKTDDKWSAAAHQGARVAASPVSFLYSLTVLFGSVVPDTYPRSGERCNTQLFGDSLGK